jgi:hypothetical protein
MKATSKAAKKTVGRIQADLIKRGYLRTETRKDAHREDRVYVEVVDLTAVDNRCPAFLATKKE